MPINHPLHPIAAAWLVQLETELESRLGRTPTRTKIVNALVYCATPEQIVGMLETFSRDRRSYNDAYAADPDGAKERAVGSK